MSLIRKWLYNQTCVLGPPKFFCKSDLKCQIFKFPRTSCSLLLVLKEVFFEDSPKIFYAEFGGCTCRIIYKDSEDSGNSEIRISNLKVPYCVNK
uniref:Uncharacterized protein n=1 Tax=Strongyloides venezuelensis TaxID=75913 RepID=A0A0K0EVZ6_STRVS